MSKFSPLVLSLGVSLVALGFAATTSAKGKTSDCRIIAVQIVKGRTQVTIACGREIGVKVGTTAYVQAGDSNERLKIGGQEIKFKIESVRFRRARGFVGLSTELVSKNPHVKVFTTVPTKPKLTKSWQFGRVLSVMADASGGSKITVSGGTDQGAKVGTKFYFVKSDKSAILGAGSGYWFKCETVTKRACSAVVEFSPTEVQNTYLNVAFKK